MILLVAAVLACLPALAVQANSGTIIYVDFDADGANDGSSWTDAHTDLQTALGVANSGDEIWVAAGTYTPGTDRIDTFQLKNEVAVYGGHPRGGGPRDWANNETILSGDLGGNDGPDGANRGDNAYHVATGGGTDDTAVLDGFTVRGGNAGEDLYLDDRGGGMYNLSGSPTVRNCTFSGNWAGYSGGGGIFNFLNSRPTVKNTILAGNTPNDCDGSVASDGYNLERHTSCGCTEDADQQNADPLLGDLQDNGGPTETHALLPGSPAIDAGSCDVATDQRGVERPQGGGCDIGAVETRWSTLRPYTTGDVNGDAAIDLLDVRLCARIAQGYLAGTPSQRAAADVDGDGDVDADDVTILSEYVLGARPTLP